MGRTLAEASDDVDRVPGGHLVGRHRVGHRSAVFRKQPPLTERDVDDVMRAPFVIRANTDEILKLSREDDGEEEEGNEDA